jgi:F-type H+-transporting ATPase subunit b
MGLLDTAQGFTKEFENFVGVNFWTMIIAWVNLLILYFILKKLLFKPVKKMIDDRQKEVDDMFESAEKDRDDAKKMKAEYEEKLESANEESEEILRSAVRRAQLKEEEILREANDEASRVLERAEEEIALEKKRALNEVKDEVSSMAIGIASAVIERDVSESEHKDLIDDFINNIGNEQ